MPTYKVLQPLNHNGQSYKEGDTVEMETKQAEPLLELKTISSGDSAPESTPLAEDVMIVTQQVSTVDGEPQEIDPKKAPPSSARLQQKGKG